MAKREPTIDAGSGEDGGAPLNPGAAAFRHAPAATQPAAEADIGTGETGDQASLGDGSSDDARMAQALADLVERAAAGDQAAWTELVGRYAPRVFAMARSRLGDRETAEDIVQSVFATLGSTLSQRPDSGDGPASAGYQERGRFESWLFRITMNRVRDEARRRRTRSVAVDPATIAEHAPAAQESLPGEAEPDEALLALRRAIALLPDADRTIVELRHHAQMAFKEIAELLEQPIGTVLARHHRALKKLKQMIENDSPEKPDD